MVKNVRLYRESMPRLNYVVSIFKHHCEIGEARPRGRFPLTVPTFRPASSQHRAQAYGKERTMACCWHKSLFYLGTQLTIY